MRSLTLALFAACTLGVAAAPLTPEQALQRATSDARCSRIVGRAPWQSLRLTYTLSPSDADEPVCYVYTTEADGFVMLSADDRGVPVLGYGDTPFDAHDMADGLRYMLDMYGDEIQHSQQPLRRIAQPRTEHEPIAPMLKTKWDQGTPYNLLCPKLNGRRCYTGCVATALAQVANYYQWPQGEGEGVKTYEWEDQELSFDFGATAFDWDNMLDTYPSMGNSLLKPTCKAVATLMYGIGVASEMMYHPDGSGAYDYTAIEGMKRYLRYNSNAYIAQRHYYGTLEWEQLVYDNLKTGPVYYSGSTLKSDGDIEAGHAFVCDGYAGDGYFHINWGWSGVSDGYFLLSALDPNDLGAGGGVGGYNYMQFCAVNLVPADGDKYETTPHYGMYMYTDFSISPEEAELGTKVTYRLSAMNASTAMMHTMTVGLKVEPESGESFIIESAKYTDVKTTFDFRNTKFTATLPADLADGMYTVRPGFTDPDGRWHDVRFDIGCVSCAYMAIYEGVATFTKQTEVGINAVIGDIAAVIISGVDFDVELRLTNPTDKDFYNRVLLLLLDAETEEIVKASGYGLVSLLPGETKDVLLTANFEYVPAGDYLMMPVTKFSEYYGIIGESVEVQIKDMPEGELDVTLNNPDADAVIGEGGAGSVDVSFDAVCTSGAGSIYLCIGIYDPSWKELYSEYATVRISEGTTVRCAFDGIKLDNVVADEAYNLFYGWYNDSGEWMSYGYHAFTFKAAGIKDIEMPGTPEKGRMYNLLGIPVDDSYRGVIIVDGEKLYRK